MSKWLNRAGVVIAVAALTTSLAGAQTKKAAKKPAAMPKCSVCKMDLVAKKDKAHSVPVKIKGKTYYCCDKCPMGAKTKKK